MEAHLGEPGREACRLVGEGPHKAVPVAFTKEAHGEAILRSVGHAVCIQDQDACDLPARQSLIQHIHDLHTGTSH